MDERLRELHALAHAGRVAAHLAVALLVKADVAKRLGGSLAGRAARQSVHLGHVRDELGRADLERETVVLRHVADQLADLEAPRRDVEPEHLRRARSRLHEPEQDLDERALAGAVRPDEPDHARLDIEVEILEGDDRAISLGKPTGGDE